MNADRPPALWIVITRPDNLPNALAVAEALRPRFAGGAHLLLERSGWWERARWETLRPRFASVQEFARIESCRGLLDLPRLVRETQTRQRVLAALPAGPDDVAVCLAGLTGLANAVASAWAAAARASRPILCVPRKKYADLRAPIDRRRFRWTAPGWLQNRVAEPLAGLHRTVHMKPRRRQGGDGVRLVRYTQEPERIFGPIVILSNTGQVEPSLSAATTATLHGAPFPDLTRLAETLGLPTVAASAGGGERRPRVVFFGTPFLLVQNLPPDVYISHLDRCLDGLRQHYGERCELVYRPHPAETEEPDRLRLADFRVETDREVAELYFLQHAREIAAVYSVSSTVSRVALNSGLNAYCLWRCFPFSPTNAAYFETLMGSVPPEFEVRDPEAPPVAYAERSAAGRETFADALRAALDVR